MKQHFETFKQRIGELHSLETERVKESRQMQEKLSELEFEDDQAEQLQEEIIDSYGETEELGIESMKILENTIDELNRVIEVLEEN